MIVKSVNIVLVSAVCDGIVIISMKGFDSQPKSNHVIASRVANTYPEFQKVRCPF